MQSMNEWIKCETSSHEDEYLNDLYHNHTCLLGLLVSMLDSNESLMMGEMKNAQFVMGEDTGPSNPRVLSRAKVIQFRNS